MHSTHLHAHTQFRVLYFQSICITTRVHTRINASRKLCDKYCCDMVRFMNSLIKITIKTHLLTTESTVDVVFARVMCRVSEDQSGCLTHVTSLFNTQFSDAASLTHGLWELRPSGELVPRRRCVSHKYKHTTQFL